MARNIEIKARVSDVSALTKRIEAIADGQPVLIVQDDVFFLCAQGRMKLRILGAREGQLVFYQRPDKQEAKESFYHVYHTQNPDELLENLTLAYGQIGRVKKKRLLYMIGRTRVHVDCVEGLGDFMELEVVLKDGEASANGIAEADDLCRKLGINAADMINGAYFDLLNPTAPTLATR